MGNDEAMMRAIKTRASLSGSTLMEEAKEHIYNKIVHQKL